MLIDIAIADTYGRGFEFIREPLLSERQNTFDVFYDHPGYPTGTVQYTDDTQMSLALAELMLKKPTSIWTEEDIVLAFLSTYARDPRSGYSKTTSKLLTSSSVKMFLSQERISEHNGASMRSPILGLIRDYHEMIRVVTMQARTTHNSYGGVASAQMAAILAWSFRHGYDFSQAWSLCEDQLQRDLPLMIKPTIFGLDTMYTVGWLLEKTTDLKKLTLAAVELGGDTDTVASIAVGIAAHKYDDHYVWPSWTYDCLENTTYGKYYLQAIDLDLQGLYNPLYGDSAQKRIL